MFDFRENIKRSIALLFQRSPNLTPSLAPASASSCSPRRRCSSVPHRTGRKAKTSNHKNLVEKRVRFLHVSKVQRHPRVEAISSFPRANRIGVDFLPKNLLLRGDSAAASLLILCTLETWPVQIPHALRAPAWRSSRREPQERLH